MSQYNCRQMMYYNGHSDYILDYKQDDVNGDGVKDGILLVGDRPLGFENPFAKNIALLVQDGVTNNYFRVPLERGVGFNPRVYLKDFSGSGIKDILINFHSGRGSGEQVSYVYSFTNNNPYQLFNFDDFNRNNKYNVIYKDDYIVKIVSKNFTKEYTLDIENKGSQYLSEIYCKNGKLKEVIRGQVIGLEGVYPIDIDRDGTYELKAINRVIGKSNGDTLGYIESILKLKHREFIPYAQYVALIGNSIE